MKTTVIAKLITGETVIGQYHDKHEEFLYDAYILHVEPTASGQLGVSYLPYMMPFSKDGSIIDSKHIVTTINPPTEVENGYIESTTGIVMKNAGNLHLVK